MPAMVRAISEQAEVDNIEGLKQLEFVHDPCHGFAIKNKHHTNIDSELLDSVATFAASKQNQSHPFHDIIIEKIQTNEFPSLQKLYEIVGISKAANPEKLKKDVPTRWLNKAEQYEALYFKLPSVSKAMITHKFCAKTKAKAEGIKLEMVEIKFALQLVFCLIYFKFMAMTCKGLQSSDLTVGFT